MHPLLLPIILTFFYHNSSLCGKTKPVRLCITSNLGCVIHQFIIINLPHDILEFLRRPAIGGIGMAL